MGKLKDPVISSNNSSERGTNMEILKCENLSKNFKQGRETIHVLKSINVEFHRGSMNIIMGESGSGKTTLLNLLAGIEQPTEGGVCYRGSNFFDLSEKKQSQIRGSDYGIVFQFFNLIPELSIEDNIKLPSIINHQSLDLKYYKKLLKILNLEKIKTKLPSRLSGGEQQRVAIARAMSLKPNIVFADEPTGNLDRKNSQIISNLFKELNSLFNTTFIIVTHDPALFPDPDFKYILYDGKLIQR